MNISSFIGITLIILVMSIVIKKYYPELFVAFETISISFLYIILIPDIKNVVNNLKNLFEIAKLSNYSQVSLLKILGICIVSQFGTDICKDSSNLALANIVSTFGKTSIILASIPILKDFLKIMLEVLRKS